MIKNYTIELETQPHELIIDITDKVKSYLDGVKNGQVTIYSTHTTMGVKVLESEALLLTDIKNFLYKLAPKDGIYYHNEVQKRQVPDNERLNAHSHLWSFVINVSETIPIINGELMLGKWQKIVLVECDPGRKRTYLIQVIGE